MAAGLSELRPDRYPTTEAGAVNVGHVVIAVLLLLILLALLGVLHV